MNKKNRLHRFISIVLVIVIVLSTCILLSSLAYSYSESNYEEAGYNFLLAQYDLRNIEYSSLTKEHSINLYDDNENVVAKMMIVNRDDKIDYVVLDFMIDRVDEFGFDQNNFVEKFKGKDKIYYAGALNYAYYDNGILKDIEGNSIDEITYFEIMETFVSYAHTLPNQTSGYAGFDSWTNIRNNANNLPTSTGYGGSVTNSSWSYIPGITVNGVANGLDFQSQTTLNNNYNKAFGKSITGTCAATAITNMFIYYEYRGFNNALLNNNIDYTFDSALTEIDWFNWNDINWWFKTVSGLESLATQAGYDYTLNQYIILTWNNVVKSIDDDIPIFTYIGVDLTNGGYFAHAIVTVGYEEFTHKYTTTEEYWLFGWKEREVENEDVYRYLRVIDGWGTSNQSRYIDFNGFYSTVMGIAFMLEE